MQRPTKWIKYLPDSGVEVAVLSVRAGAYPHLDPAMDEDIPPGTTVVRTLAPDPFGLYGRFTGRSRGEVIAARTGRVVESLRAVRAAEVCEVVDVRPSRFGL